MQPVWLCGLLLLLFSISTVAQQPVFQRFNEFNMQPEVWSFATPAEGNVDSKGDLHLRIPVLTVPGSPGRSFEIEFSYRAGIRYHQTASWLGLGWNFDPGSITRDVKGNLISNGVHYGVDRVDDPSTAAQMPDAFFVNLPGIGTIPMGRATVAGFNENTNVKSFRAPYNASKFYLETHLPYKIETLITDRENHPWPGESYHPLLPGKYITRFMITTDENVRYVFGNPTVAAFRSFSGLAQTIYHPNAWRLLAIAGPEYHGDIGLLLQKPDAQPASAADIYSALESLADWIRFDYGFDENEPVAIGNSGPEQAIENTYLRFITTPSHRAEFITVADRKDADLVYARNNTEDISRFYRRLKHIELATRSGEVNQIVEMNHGNSLSDYVLGKGASGGISRGKLTLHGFFYRDPAGETLPGYDFVYPEVGSAGNPEWSFNPSHHYYDGLGYYNDMPHPGSGIDTNPNDAAAWSLRKMVFPTGGWESYRYSNDQIDQQDVRIDRVRYNLSTGQHQYDEMVFDFDAWPAGGSRRQGGVRVTRITRSDGMGNAEYSEFSYGPGTIGCMPSRLLPFVNSHFIEPNAFRAVNRGEQDVVYEWIRRAWSDSSSVKTYYQSNSSCRTILFQSPVYSERWVAFAGAIGMPAGAVRSAIVRSTAREGQLTTSADFNYLTSASKAALVLDLADLLPYKAYAWQTSSYIIEEKQKEFYNPDVVRAKTILREYIEETGQLKRETISTPEWKIDKQLRYAWQIPEYGGNSWETEQITGMRSRNQLAALAEETAFSKNNRLGVTSLHGTYRQTWRETPEIDSKKGEAPTAWRLYERYDLAAPGDLAFPPEFNAWEVDEMPGTHWQLGFRVLEYSNGNRVLFEDGRGEELALFYGNNENNFSNLAHHQEFGHAYLTGISMAGQVFRAYDYNQSSLNMESVEDENGIVTRYNYDSFSRLTTIKDRSGRIISKHSYSYGRDAGEEMHSPNSVISQFFQDATKQRNETVFSNGLGEAVQTVITADNRNTYLTNELDLQGRIYSKYLPYARSVGQPVHFDSLYDRRNADGTLSDQKTNRVTQYLYPGKFTGNPQRIAYPTESGTSTNQLFMQRFQKASEVFPEVYPTSRSILLRTDYSRDEAGRERASYFDELNNLVGSQLFSGSTEATAEVNASCYNDGNCNEGEAADSKLIVLDEPQRIGWSCSITANGPYLSGEFSITNLNGSVSFLSLSEDGNWQGEVELAAGSYLLRAVARRLNPQHNAPARVIGDVTFWNPGQLSSVLKSQSDVDAAGNQLIIRPPNFFAPPSGSNANDWLMTQKYNTLNLPMEDNLIDSGRRQYRYDPHGNLRFMQDANMRNAGIVRFYIYDFLDRLKLVGHANADFDELNPAESYFFEHDDKNWVEVNCYDMSPDFTTAPWNIFPNSRYTTFTHHLPVSRRTAHAYFSNGAWQVELFSYDERGNLRETRKLNAEIPLADLQLSYDLQDNPLSLTVQAGDNFYSHHFDYDERDRLAAVRTAASLTSHELDVKYDYAVEGMQNFIGLGYANGSTPTVAMPYEHNLRGWLVSSGQITNTAYGMFQRFAYSPDGRINQVDFLDHNELLQRYDYAFDSADRLRSATYSEFDRIWQEKSAYKLNGFSYDASGNILGFRKYDGEGELLDRLDYHYGESNQIQTILDRVNATEEKWDAESSDFSYDANGNIIRIEQATATMEIDYDWFNRPIYVKTFSGAELQFSYNRDNQRVAKKNGSYCEAAIFAKKHPLGQFHNGKLVHWNIIGEKVEGRWLPAQVDSKTGETIAPVKHYFLRDYQGSVKRVVSEDGELLAAMEFYPFGQLMPGKSYLSGATTGTPGFSGQHGDDETGWLSFGRRYYDPSLGRWLSPDPKALDYLSISPYAFTANDPVSKVEQDGAYFETIFDVISLGFSIKDLVIDPASYSNWTAVGLDLVGILTPGAAGLGTLYKTLDRGSDALGAVRGSSQLVDGLCSGKRYLFRGDRRMPSEVFEKGFQPRGESMDVLKHARNNIKPPSNYVSTTSAPGIAAKFSQKGNYVYVVRPKGGVDVNKALGDKSPYPYEKEFAIPGGVKTEDILGARQVDKDGKFVGEFIKNPNYKE
ncbi:MAG: scabin-related ADP-ribosyltransferase [Calditrichia bacterium]